MLSQIRIYTINKGQMTQTKMDLAGCPLIQLQQSRLPSSVDEYMSSVSC